MKKSISFDAHTLLKAHEFRTTSIRVAILEALAATQKPLSIAQIAKVIRKYSADTATIYRALEAFVERGIVRRLPLHNGMYSYDLTSAPHAHHVVCMLCNAIERISFCVRGIENSAKEKSRLFKSISGHTLSFSGTCRKCARAVR